MDNKLKKRAFKAFGAFLTFMFLMTFISRMYYTSKLPVVSVSELNIQNLSHVVNADGTLKANKKIPIIVPDGFRIDEIKVKVGNEVKKGDPILQLDNVYLDKMITQKENALKSQITNSKGAYYEIGKMPIFIPSNIRVFNLFVQSGDYVNVGQKILSVDMDYLYEYIIELQNAIDENIVQRDKSYEENDIASGDLYNQQIENGYAVIDKYRAIANNGGIVYSNYSGIVTDVNIEVGSVSTDEAVVTISENPILNAEFSELDSELSEMKNIREQNGVINSPCNGTVSEVLVNSGDFTTMNAAFIFSDNSEGFTFSAIINEDDSKYLSCDDNVTLSFNAEKLIMNDIKIENISKEDDDIKVDAFINDERLTDGIMGKLKYTVYSPITYVCLDRSAVNIDTDGSTEGYIYIVSEVDGFLGEEYIVRRQNVSIEDSNNKFIGVTSFFIDENEYIVVNSSKKLFEGQKVRIIK